MMDYDSVSMGDYNVSLYTAGTSWAPCREDESKSGMFRTLISLILARGRWVPVLKRLTFPGHDTRSQVDCNCRHTASVASENVFKT